MTDTKIESISALVDDELTELELDDFLHNYASEPDMQKSWRRYHQAQSLLKGEALPELNLDVSAAVMKEIESLPTPRVKESKIISLWHSSKQSLSSMSLAASVTLAVVFGAQYIFGGANYLEDIRPNYSLFDFADSNTYQRTQFGHQQQQNTTEAKIIRQRSLADYVNLHQFLLTHPRARTKISWVPEGFVNLEHSNIANAELIRFANKSQAFSVFIEPATEVSHLPKPIEIEAMSALVSQQGDYIVTLVGNVPLSLAERIVQSVDIQ